MVHCGVKAFEDNVCKFALHESLVNILEDTRGFSLNNANVMDASRTDPDYFLVH